VNWNADAKTLPWYPVNITTDVVVLLKTGYGTRGRVQAWFEANMPPKQEKNGMGFGEGNVLVVGDYASKPGKGFVWQGREFVVRDMAGKMLEDARNMLGEREVVKEKYPRVGKYEALRQAIEKGDEEQAMKLSKEWGWELDALKVCMSLPLTRTSRHSTHHSSRTYPPSFSPTPFSPQNSGTSSLTMTHSSYAPLCMHSSPAWTPTSRTTSAARSVTIAHASHTAAQEFCSRAQHSRQSSPNLRLHQTPGRH